MGTADSAMGSRRSQSGVSLGGGRRHRAGRQLPLPFLLPAMAMVALLLLAGEGIDRCLASSPSSLHMKMKVRHGAAHLPDLTGLLVERRRLQLGGFGPIASSAPPSRVVGSAPGGGGGGGGGGFGQTSSVKGDLSLRSIFKHRFTVDVLMGMPPQGRTLDVGFSEYFSWTFCNPSLPERAINPPFASESSSSFTVSTCPSLGCNPLEAASKGACQAGTCSVAYYADREQSHGLVGQLASDFIQIKGEPRSRIRFDNMACITSIAGEYINYTSDGVLAVGPSNSSFFYAITEELQLPRTLSLCFNSTGYTQRRSSYAAMSASIDDGGSMVFGTRPAWISYPEGPAVSPVIGTEVGPRTAYSNYLTLIESWSVGSSLVASALQGPPVAYFGRTNFLTVVPQANLTTILRSIQSATSLTPEASRDGSVVYIMADSTCDVSSFPEISVTFKGGVTLTAKPEEYTVIIMDRSGQGCLVFVGFIATEDGEYFDIGMSMLQSKWLTFDMSAGNDVGALRIGTGHCQGSPLV